MNALINLVKKPPIIFYGAGQYAPSIFRTLAEMGIEPICFCDQDQRKHHTTLLGKEILPLSLALAKYPDALIYLTVLETSCDSIKDQLLKSRIVSANQFLNDKIGEKYKSCFALEHELTTSNGSFTPCCIPFARRPTHDIINEDYDAGVKAYFKARTQWIAALNSEEITSYCNACPLLTKRTWLKSSKIDVINVSDLGVCQFNCIYCSNPNKNGKMSNKPVTNFSKLIAALKRNELIDHNLLIKIGLDEVTAHPECDAILSAFTGYPCEVFTNAAIYREKIQELLCHERSSILVSMDSGTRETFAKIKNVDAFEAVRKNLIRYNARGGKVKLKYIVLPNYNDRIEDADGFIELCKEVNAANVIISGNRVSRSKLPESAVETARRIRYRAEKEGIMVSYLDFFFSKNMIDIIKMPMQSDDEEV